MAHTRCIDATRDTTTHNHGKCKHFIKGPIEGHYETYQENTAEDV